MDFETAEVRQAAAVHAAMPKAFTGTRKCDRNRVHFQFSGVPETLVKAIRESEGTVTIGGHEFPLQQYDQKAAQFARTTREVTKLGGR